MQKRKNRPAALRLRAFTAVTTRESAQKDFASPAVVTCRNCQIGFLSVTPNPSVASKSSIQEATRLSCGVSQREEGTTKAMARQCVSLPAFCSKDCETNADFLGRLSRMRKGHQSELQLATVSYASSSHDSLS